MVGATPARTIDRAGHAGYTLVGLLVVVAVVNIGLAAAATSWITLDQRAREAELIWRGEQIEAAIACYASAVEGESLERLEQLVESNCLRRMYRDPMSDNGEWRILRRSDIADGTVAALLGQAAPGADPESDGQVNGQAQEGQLQRPLLRRPGLLGATGGLSGDNVIVGVMTSRIGPSLRVYRQSDRYEGWVFLADGGDTPTP